jgi:hypothetical protein
VGKRVGGTTGPPLLQQDSRTTLSLRSRPNRGGIGRDTRCDLFRPVSTKKRKNQSVARLVVGKMAGNRPAMAVEPSTKSLTDRLVTKTTFGNDGMAAKKRKRLKMKRQNDHDFQMKNRKPLTLRSIFLVLLALFRGYVFLFYLGLHFQAIQGSPVQPSLAWSSQKIDQNWMPYIRAKSRYLFMMNSLRHISRFDRSNLSCFNNFLTCFFGKSK